MSEHDHAGTAVDGRVETITGDEAVSRFVDMWLAGYMSGVASALTNARDLTDERFSPQRPGRLDDAQVESMARRMVEAAAEDPLFVEEVRREVTHLLVCGNTGPERWKTSP